MAEKIIVTINSFWIPNIFRKKAFKLGEPFSSSDYSKIICRAISSQFLPISR